MDLFNELNAERKRLKELYPFVANAKLFAAARKYAKFMADKGQGVGHLMDGRKPWERAWAAGYPRKKEDGNDRYVLEAVAGGQGTPEAVVASWLASTAGHREAVLHNVLTEIGLGNARSADGTNVWVLKIGNSPEANNPPQPVVSPEFNIFYRNKTGGSITIVRVDKEGKGTVNELPDGIGKDFPYLPGETSVVQHENGKMLRFEKVNKAETVVYTAKDARTESPTPHPDPPQPPQTSVLTVSKFEKDLFDQLNIARLAAKLPKFKPNIKLFAAARNHASHMARVGRVTHTLDGKTPSDRARELGYPGNVDELYNGGANHADRVVSDWLSRPDLAAKILSPGFTEVGVGFDRSADTTKVWNIVLGNSAGASNPPQLQLQ